jgi:hypothetical protein
MALNKTITGGNGGTGKMKGEIDVDVIIMEV